MNTTVRLKASEIYKDWHVIDAANRPLGRVATEAATLLRGKHKPAFEPHLDAGDFVIVVNASKVRVTGAKGEQRRYYRHSGYPGGLKSRTYTEQMARFPERILEQAIWGMLPGGPLGKKILRHLKVYRGPNHPHASQIAFTEKSRAARAEAAEALKTTPRKAPRLRPLSVPQEEPSPSRDRQGAVGDTPTTAPPERQRRGKAPKAAAAATIAAELEATDEAVLTSETPPPAAATVNEEVVVAEQATPAEAAIEQGEPIAEANPARSRKRAESTAGLPKTPRARKSTADAGAEAAPKTTRARKPKAEAESADAAAEKKPARRRTTKSEE
jgi:large subunit ribosomal protein L13